MDANAIPFISMMHELRLIIESGIIMAGHYAKTNPVEALIAGLILWKVL